MGKRKGVISLVLVLVLSLVLTGCSTNEMAIFDASMKSQEVKSMQSHATITANLKGSGLDETMQEQLDSFAEMLNAAKIDLTMKISGNEDNTVLKSQADMNLTGFGQEMKIPFWIDMDYSDKSKPKFQEIFMLPELAKESFPAEYADKDYMVMDLLTMNKEETGLQPIDMTQLMELNNTLTQDQMEFFKSYAKRYNPDLDVVKEATKDGDKYTIKLNDKEFKDFLSYTVNHFAKDEEAMKFLQSYLSSMNEVGAVPSEVNLDQVDEFLTQFNLVMNGLKDVTILGDQGVAVSYTVSKDGYIVKDSTVINLHLDLKQLEAVGELFAPVEMTAEATEVLAEESEYLPEVTEDEMEMKGTIDLTINMTSETTNINEPVDVQIPAFFASNSFDYMDLMKAMEEEAQAQFRLSGENRYQTAKRIAEELNSGISSDVILTSGTNYRDAMSATLLSKKLGAPILLVGPNDANLQEALTYMEEHADQNTNVHIMGGTAAVSQSVEKVLKDKGFTTERLAGKNYFETNLAILNKADIATGTSLIIASGDSFPDSIGAASYAAAMEYPLVLVGKDQLKDETKKYITAHKPSTVYIVGGENVVSKSVLEQVKKLVPSANIERLGGKDRFETSSKVLKAYNPSADFVFLANGFSFADALTGSSLAAQYNAPIVLINPNQAKLPAASESYLKEISGAEYGSLVWTLGGEKAVPQHIVEKVNGILNQ